VSAEESLTRAEELLARLEKARTELAELSKAIEEELQRAKREAEADAES
jgi:5-bromo-4-chloroindolyl phosphate hydrolysis protein